MKSSNQRLNELKTELARLDVPIDSNLNIMKRKSDVELAEDNERGEEICLNEMERELAELDQQYYKISGHGDISDCEKSINAEPITNKGIIAEKSFKIRQKDFDQSTKTKVAPQQFFNKLLEAKEEVKSRYVSKKINTIRTNHDILCQCSCTASKSMEELRVHFVSYT